MRVCAPVAETLNISNERVFMILNIGKQEPNRPQEVHRDLLFSKMNRISMLIKGCARTLRTER